ncbi:cytochrome P450 monooxygenase helB2 [Aspergillus lucknowensis]|uniref:Cytochrome P450 n=1 Tax=Aspergillus lucknowensis TaxID=176173 RepID=A0ABR4LHT2_9EURO
MRVLALAGALLVCWRILDAFVFSPLRRIPGPLAARLTPLRFIYARLPGRVIPAALQDFHAYGDIYISKPRTVTISNPYDVRTVLSASDFRKVDVYHGLNDPVMANLVTFSEPTQASRRRRQIGPYFNPSYLAKMEPLILRNGIQALKAKWDRLLDEHGECVEVNYRHDMQLATFDIMSALAFGRELDSLASLKTQKVAIVDWISATAIYIGVSINFRLLLAFPFSRLIRRWLREYADFVQFGKESVARRKEILTAGEDKPADLLQAFIDAEDPESKVKMSAVEVQAESVGMQLAGSETTAASLTWALHLLTLYPDCHRRAVDEVRGQFPADHLITYAECNQLPFLEAFLYEMLRYTPITSSFMPRVASKGIALQGQWIPPGTEIAFNLIAMNNRGDVWDQPERFIPERFLNNKDLKRSILAFSYGGRSCIGRGLAWMEMMTILANILKDYDLSAPADSVYGPHNLDNDGIPRRMPSKCHIVFAPTDPDRDCRLVIRRH